MCPAGGVGRGLLIAPGRTPLLASLAIAASACGLALYSRFAWPWLVFGWVALVPWLATLDRLRSMRAALVSGLVMAVAFELAVFGWFAPAIAGYTGAPTLLAVLALAAGAPLLQPQFVTFAAARHLARAAAPDAHWLAAFAAAGIYVGTEWAIPKLFADTLGYGLYPSIWLRQGADVVGVSGLTFALVLANECVLVLAHVARADTSRSTAGRIVAPVVCLALIFSTLLGYGVARTRALAATTVPGNALTAGVVQANLSHYDDLRAAVGSYEAVRRILDAHVALSTELGRRADLDLLVWPETVYPTTFGTPKSADGAAFDLEIATFVAGAHVPLVFGAYDLDGAAEFNAAVVLEPPSAGPGGAAPLAWRRTPGPDPPLAFETYQKASLFPLTERVPAVLESDLLRGWMPWLGMWKPGAGAKVIPVALPGGTTVRVAPLICYDVLAPALVYAATRAGAELFVTLSNDSWFAAGNGPRLHLIGAAFRSIETRRPQVRATNTGISAVITATGDIVATAGVDERTAFAATVTPDGRTTSVLVAWGEWFGPTALVGGLALLTTALARRRRPPAG